MLNTTAGSPGEPEEAAESCTDDAMQKLLVNEGLHTPLQDAQGVLHAPGAKMYRRCWLTPDSSVTPTSPLSRSV